MTVICLLFDIVLCITLMLWSIKLWVVYFALLIIKQNLPLLVLPVINLLLSPRLGHCIYENRQSVAKYFSDFLDPNLHGKELQSAIPI